MSWVTFIALTVLVFGQSYCLYPESWRHAWQKVKHWFGV